MTAFAGNANVADELIDLAAHNVSLSGHSAQLAAQQAQLTEAADSATIAADVWRAKCLAGRVIALEAARRMTLVARQAHLARCSLAHLLGERARIRQELRRTLTSLGGTIARQVEDVQWDTLSLASQCSVLAESLGVPQTSLPDSSNGHCAETPGEQLAIQVSQALYPT